MAKRGPINPYHYSTSHTITFNSQELYLLLQLLEKAIQIKIDKCESKIEQIHADPPTKETFDFKRSFPFFGKVEVIDHPQLVYRAEGPRIDLNRHRQRLAETSSARTTLYCIATLLPGTKTPHLEYDVMSAIRDYANELAEVMKDHPNVKLPDWNLNDQQP